MYEQNKENDNIVGPIFVKGHPQTFGDKRYEEPWKKKIACEIRKYYSEDRPKIRECVQICLKFFISKERKVDLDNLIKPCIDAIGSCIFEKRGRTHSIWDTDDSWVYKIVAEKENVERESEEGVKIEVKKLSIRV